MKATDYIRIIDGSPVPYSGTVQRKRSDTGEWESIESAATLVSEIENWISRNRPGCKVIRTEGPYFFY